MKFWLAWLLLLSIAVAVYAPALGSPFIFDDDHFIMTNPNVILQAPIPITSSRWFSIFTYRLNYFFSGLNPFPFHAFDLAIHLSVSTLILILLRRYLFSWPAALFGAGLFLLHPLNSEAVIYLSARTELLAAFFGLISLLLWQRGRFVFAGLALFLAVCSKESAVVFIGLILLDQIYRKRFSVAQLVTIGSVTLFAATAFVHRMSFEWADRAWNEHFLLQAGQCLRLSALIVWPFGQTIDHDAELRSLVLCGIGAGLLAVTVWLFYLLRNHRPMLLFGAAWIFIVLIPRFLLNIPEFMAEHHMYLPMVGFSLIAADLIFKSDFQFKEN